MSAIEQGSLDIAKLLIENGADVNIGDNFELTPILVAEDYNHPKIWLTQRKRSKIERRIVELLIF